MNVSMKKIYRGYTRGYKIKLWKIFGSVAYFKIFDKSGRLAIILRNKRGYGG